MKHKKRNFLTILIPCAVFVSSASIVLPMVCLATKPAHLKISADYREWKISLEDLKTNSHYFVFHVIDNIESDQIISHLKYSWNYTTTSDHKCKLELSDELIYDPISKNGQFALSLKTRDGNWPNVGDCISYDMKFEYFDDNNKVVWSQIFTNNYWKVEN